MTLLLTTNQVIMWNERTELLIKKDAVDYLKNSRILIVGVGGVGGYAAEHICRAGVGNITIMDSDTINDTNLNRQLIALHSTLNRPKVEVMQERMLDINPSLNVTAINDFLTPETVSSIVNSDSFDYVVDAIDTLAPKIALCVYAIRNKIPIVSSMGAGGRIDPTKLKVDDISKTYNDKLAAAVRHRLRQENIYSGMKVVFSTEVVNPDAVIQVQGATNQRSVRGTISYLPSMFGCMIAGVVINDLIKKIQKKENK